MQPHTVQAWIDERDPLRLERLWQEADAARRAHVGDDVHLRGLIEISNICVRHCHYCGLRAPNAGVRRYRMTADEIVACARLADELGYGTVVLQSGEDPAFAAEDVAEIVRRVKRETPLAVTLSLGERAVEEWALWKDAGADRYLLRFETSDRALFEKIHPPRPAEHGGRASGDRIAMLRELRALGYEVGSGIMIGIPGQPADDLARSLELFGELELDMIGVGPFLAHPNTPLGRECGVADSAGAMSAAELELMTYKVMALTRLTCPRANIPSTTALATVNRAAGREIGLQRGANVIMPNLTPASHRSCYEIYPGKACLFEDPRTYDGWVKGRIERLGRCVGRGRGDSPSWMARHARRESAGVTVKKGL